MNPLVRKGSSGVYVRILQDKLKKVGYTITVDGSFGDATYRSVVDYQTKKQISIDGVVGDGTWNILNKEVPYKWQQIPFPTLNKSAKHAIDTLKAIASLTGTDYKLLYTFASIESNFDYLVKASTSSAVGWFQFLDLTYTDELAKHGKKYDIPEDAKRELRPDPRVNGILGAEFLAGNSKFLKSRINREPVDTDLYLAHFLGATGAVKFLTTDQSLKGDAVFPKQAAANKPIFYKDKGKGVAMTLAEIYKLLENKVSSHRPN